jgi:hypothetical protein
MAYKKLSDMNEDDADKFREIFGPGHVDTMLRQAINMCWMGLPRDKKSPEHVETEIRRMFDAALRDFRTNYETFRKRSDDTAE